VFSSALFPPISSIFCAAAQAKKFFADAIPTSRTAIAVTATTAAASLWLFTSCSFPSWSMPRPRASRAAHSHRPRGWPMSLEND
jgi:hypothetical protein